MSEPAFIIALRTFCAALKQRGMPVPVRISLSPEAFAELEMEIDAHPDSDVAHGFVPAEGRPFLEIDGIIIEPADPVTMDLSQSTRQPAGTRQRHWSGGEYMRVGGEPEDEAEHFYRCARCGQMVDKRDLAAVLHHEEPDHEPLGPVLVSGG